MADNENKNGIVFPGISGVVDIYDNTRTELILVEFEGAKANEPKPFSNLYIMNFESSDKSDYMVNKDIANSFLFTSFGHSATTMILSGYQSSGVTQTRDKGKTLTKSNPTDDAEYIYRQYCISGPTPRTLRITTGVNGIVTKGSVYRGYMVSFTKKPMGE